MYCVLHMYHVRYIVLPIPILLYREIILINVDLYVRFTSVADIS